MESSVAVANWFIRKTLEEDNPTADPIKIQKLVYFAYCWHLAITGRPLTRDPLLVKHWGPYLPELLTAALDNMDENLELNDTLSRSSVDLTLVPLLERIWELYSKYTPVQLSRMTTYDDSPWRLTLQNNPGREHVQIPDSLIETHYKEKMSNGQN